MTTLTAPEIITLPAPALEAISIEPRRIGLFGGTFDPPHVGHLVLAMIAAEQLELDRVLFIPAGRPPHKQAQPVSSATERLLLTRLAIAGEPNFELSPVEVERPGISYTIDTLDALTSVYGPDVDLYLIFAADSYANLDSWREPDRLLELAHWAIGGRPGWELPSREELERRFGERHERIHVVDGPSLAISSSALRSRVAEGRSIRYLVPRAVEDQIAARGLYRR